MSPNNKFREEGSAEAAQDVGNCPPMPRNDAEWVEAMELDWALIQSSELQQQAGSNHEHL